MGHDRSIFLPFTHVPYIRESHNTPRVYCPQLLSIIVSAMPNGTLIMVIKRKNSENIGTLHQDSHTCYFPQTSVGNVHTAQVDNTCPVFSQVVMQLQVKAAALLLLAGNTGSSHVVPALTLTNCSGRIMHLFIWPRVNVMKRKPKWLRSKRNLWNTAQMFLHPGWQLTFCWFRKWLIYWAVCLMCYRFQMMHFKQGFPLWDCWHCYMQLKQI